MPPKKRKALYWLLGIAGFLVLMLGAITFFFAARFEPLVKEQLEAQVQKNSKGLYRLEIKSLDILLPFGSIYLQSPRLIPDSNRYQQLIASKAAPQSLFTISCQSIHFAGINFWEYFKHKKLSLRSITVNTPQLLLIKDLTVVEKDQPKKNLYQLISKVFSSIELNVIKINNADLTYKRKTEKSTTRIDLNKFNLIFEDFKVDSLAELDSTRFFYSKNIRIQIPNFEYLTNNKRYKLKVGQFKLNTSDSSIVLNKVFVQPQYKKYEFARKVGEQTDCLQLTSDSIIIRGAHFKTFLFDERIITNRIEIIHPLLEAFRDKNVPFKSAKNKLLYHELLQQIEHPLLIKEVLIKDGKIDYEEIPPGKNKGGTIYFTNLRALFKNISNLPESQNSKITLEAKAYLMGAGEMRVNFRFPINPMQKRFQVEGVINSMALNQMNPTLEKLAFLRVKSGRLNRLYFNINADSETSNTYMKFLYTDLEIQLLNEKGDTDKQRLASKLVNSLIIDYSNPIPGMPVRIGNTSYKRDQTRSLFNYLWKSLFSAIKPSIGIDVNKELKIAELKNRQQSSQQKKSERREARKRMREMERQQKKEKRDEKESGNNK